MPSDKTRSKRRLRLLALAQALVLLASLGIPIPAMAAISAVVPGAQAPDPVTAGGTATYHVQVTNGSGATTRGVSITSISGLPAGAALGTSECIVVPGDGVPRTIVVTVTTTAATPAGTSAITMTATRWTAASGNCGNGVADTLTGSGSLTVAAAKLDQTITFGALPDRRPDQLPLTVSATASSGLAVTFSSATTAVCTVSGTTVSYVANGTCTIHADQAGDASWNAAPQVARSFAIAKGDQTITFGALPDLMYGAASFELAATASSGLPVSYASLTPGVCTVSGTTLAIAGIGQCTVEASQAGDANHDPAEPVTRSFQVLAAGGSTPDTSTGSPIASPGGPGSIPLALAWLMAVWALATLIVLYGLRARPDGGPGRRTDR